MRKRVSTGIGTLLLQLCVFSCVVFAQDTDDFTRYLPSHSFSQVLVGENSVTVFDAEPTTPLSKGVVIILTTTGQFGLSLNEGLILAKSLNDWGWFTSVVPVSLNVLNNGDVQPAPPIEQVDETAPTALPPIKSVLSPVVDYQKTQTQILQLMSALYNHASNRVGFTIVVSHGMFSAQLLALTNEGTLAAPDSMVTISPYWPEKEKNNAISNLVGMSSYPLLDISVAQQSRWDSDTVAARKQQAVRDLKVHYRQKVIRQTQLVSSMSEAKPSPNMGWLSKEIYGWLTYLGW